MAKVYITSMIALPTFCFDCPCCDHQNGDCQADPEKRSIYEYRPFWCPLSTEAPTRVDISVFDDIKNASLPAIKIDKRSEVNE